MSEAKQADSEAAARLAALDAAWERRKRRVLLQLTETPLDKWLRRKR